MVTDTRPFVVEQTFEFIGTCACCKISFKYSLPNHRRYRGNHRIAILIYKANISNVTCSDDPVCLFKHISVQIIHPLINLNHCTIPNTTTVWQVYNYLFLTLFLSIMIRTGQANNTCLFTSPQLYWMQWKSEVSRWFVSLIAILYD